MKSPKLRDESVEAGSDKAEMTKSVRGLFEKMHHGWTDEDLLTRPSEAEHFCNVVRVEIQDEVDDAVLTGYLINPRKKKGNAYGKPRQGVPLILELRAAGISLEPDMFRDRIVELFHGLYRNATPEAVLRRPKEGKLFCSAVRQNLTLPDLTERLICQTLMNRRKAGDDRLIIKPRRPKQVAIFQQLELNLPGDAPSS